MAGSKQKMSDDEIKRVIHRISLGETIKNLAVEYNTNPNALYQRICKAKKRMLAKGESLEVTFKAPTKEKHAAKALTLEESMDALTLDFVTKMRELLLRQVFNNLKTMT